MKIWLCRVSVILLLSVSTVSVAIARDTQIAGNVSGIELCTQQICGAAIFVGIFNGTVDGKPAFGFWSAAVQHDPLPLLNGPPSQIRQGSWQMQVYVFSWFFPRKQKFAGDMQPGGTIAQPVPNIFQVLAELNILRGGQGSMNLGLALDHTRLPFTVTGVLWP